MNQQMTFLNSSDIAVYIPGNDKAKQRKQGWSGLRMLCTEINRAGYEIDYCDKETVNLHKVILVSLISALDWFDFIAERVQWPAGNYKVIIGGAGVDNVRPFLEYADIFVFGRAENIIAPLIQATLENQRFFDPSVCYLTHSV
jgi:hypothetical protein